MNEAAVVRQAPVACTECGTEYPSRLLACPRCGRLLHARELAQLAARAEAASGAGATADALAAWRRVLELVPPGSKQAEQVTEKIAALEGGAAARGGAAAGVRPGAGAAGPGSADGPRRGRLVAGLGVAGLVARKLKVVALFVVTKAKLLLLGFTKAGTLLSALASFGVYWTVWGWKLALGLIISTYLHEMGHVAAMHRYGIPATAPMFIPGLGAYVRGKRRAGNLRQDARIALAGPLWGLGAAASAWAVGTSRGDPFWLALAKLGAFINLFNLVPLGPLDGGHAFRALGRQQRWGLVMVIATAMVISGEPLLILLLLAVGARALGRDLPAEGDRGAFALFGAILFALALLARIPVPVAAGPAAAGL